jgi:hypothetical protein
MYRKVLEARLANTVPAIFDEFDDMACVGLYIRPEPIRKHHLNTTSTL